MKRYTRGKQQPAKPATPEAGAAMLRAYAVTLYDQGDGQGANWRAMTEALFLAAFGSLDRLPDEACRAVARRVHEGSYSRLTDGPRSSAPAPVAGVDRGQEMAPTHDQKPDAQPR